jgi:hypothetical protein
MTENVFPKVKGSKLYASESNAFNQAVLGYTKGNNDNLFIEGMNLFELGDNTFLEPYETDIAVTKTNLTHSTDRDEYYSVTDGAYELATNDYYTEDNCTKAYVFVDYNIYKELDETTLTSAAAPSSGSSETITNDGTVDLYDIKSVYFLFYFKNLMGATASSAGNRLRVSDGSGSYSNIITLSGARQDTKYYRGFCKLYNDTSNKLLKGYLVYEYDYFDTDDDDTFYRNYFSPVAINYSAYSNLYLNTYASATRDSTSATATTTIYGYRAYKQNPSTTAVISVSSDGGSNYTTVSNGSMVSVPSGNQFKVKLAGTLAANEGISIKRVIIKAVA